MPSSTATPVISLRTYVQRARRRAAFTLVEVLISASLAGVLGGIIYLVAGEALASFARNISINRSYSDARMTIDRIAQTVASAGHTPILVDTNGAQTATSSAAGIRFYRANSQSTYKITVGATGPSSASRSLTLQLGAGQIAPLPKDMLTIATIGYQGVISSVVTTGSSCVLGMVDTIATDCSPAPTATINLTSPQQYVQSYTQVAFIVVGNQLRYYPQAKSVATDTAAVFNNPAYYRVFANLVSTADNSSGTAATPLLPFSIVNPPTVSVQLYAENPDYNNRSTAAYQSINSADRYTFMQCSLGVRSPVQVHGPY